MRFFVKKSQKRQKVRSISQLCLHFVQSQWEQEVTSQNPRGPTVMNECKSTFLYGETPKSMTDSVIDLPAGPRGTAPAAAHPPNRYGPAPHTLPARETG